MALDSNYLPQSIFLEVFEKNSPEGPQYVTRRDDVTHMTDEQRTALGRVWAARIKDEEMTEFYAVRLARYTVEVLEKF